MPKTLETCLIEAIATKRQLAHRISEQMLPDVKAGNISLLTAQQNKLAIDNLDAAALNLEKGELEQAVHFFSRGCWNMGEFKGRSDEERKPS